MTFLLALNTEYNMASYDFMTDYTSMMCAKPFVVHGIMPMMGVAHMPISRTKLTSHICQHCIMLSFL